MRSKNGPLNGTVTNKNGTAVYGRNGNDNGKFGSKNGPSLLASHQITITVPEIVLAVYACSSGDKFEGPAFELYITSFHSRM